MNKGSRGEQIAGQYMEGMGNTVIRYNYRCRFGEIDLVLQSGEYLVFLEVKLRKNSRFSSAAEAVTQEKQRKIRLTAQYYLQENRTSLQPRFDVLEIYAPDGLNSKLSFNLIKNAF